MKDIERIAKLEIQVENLFKENEKLQNANRKLKVEVYQMQKQLRFFIWNGKDNSRNIAESPLIRKCN